MLFIIPSLLDVVLLLLFFFSYKPHIDIQRYKIYMEQYIHKLLKYAKVKIRRDLLWVCQLQHDVKTALTEMDLNAGPKMDLQYFDKHCVHFCGVLSCVEPHHDYGAMPPSTPA